MYNSSVGFNRDDLTMTNDPYPYGHYNAPVTTNMPIPGGLNETSRTNYHGNEDYVFVNHNLLETARQIEQVLYFYRQDLKQDSNTQYNSNQQLIRRLIDLIRPAYSTHQEKLSDLDRLYDEISLLHDMKFAEQNEKLKQLQGEIGHMKALIMTSGNDDDALTKLYQINSMTTYEQWMEMEEETKRLQDLIEMQQTRINELVQLVPKEEIYPFQIPTTTINDAFPQTPTANNNQNPITTDVNPKSSLIDRVRALAAQPIVTGMHLSVEPISELYSPGSSPIHSLTDFLTKSLVDTVNIDSRTQERLAVTTHPLPLLARISSYHNNNNTNNKTSCCICNHEFDSTVNEFEILLHVDKCLATAGIHDVLGSEEPRQYTCPNCERQFPGDEERVYHQHLADCFTDNVQTF